MSLPPLLEQIYATGQVETEEGDVRAAEPAGVPRDHALRLAALVRGENLRSTLETGMAYGLSTLAIAGVHAERGEGRHVAIDPTIDSAFEGIGRANLRRAGLEDRVRIIRDGSEAALPRLVEEGLELDFAFIDGMHLFDYALLDFFYADRMLVTGGYVAFHDTWMPAVQDAVGFVLANRGYERADRSDRGMIVLRKGGEDRRPWNHHRAFARPRERTRPGGDSEAALFELLEQGAHQSAARTGGFRDHDLLLAGRAVQLRFASDRLEAALLPAFGHALAHAPAGEPDLRILLWESEVGGIPEPEVPWGIGDVRARGDVRGFGSEAIGVHCEQGSGAITLYDRASRTMVFWVTDSRIVPWFERGSPLRAALHHWGADHGLHFVHAGAVGVDGGGVLLAGASGSGKSTTALACLEAGMGYAGDDYVILDDGDARCLYSIAKLDTGALERLPTLASAVLHHRRGEERKAILDVHRHAPLRIRDAIPLTAVVVPVVGAAGGRPELARATAAQALRALAPTSLLQLPGAAQERMAAMSSLVRRLPAFHLRLGSDLDAAVDEIARVCADPQAVWHSASAAV